MISLSYLEQSWTFFVSHISSSRHSVLFTLVSLDVLNNLPNKLLNLTVVQRPKRKQFTLKDVSAHCTETDCWMVIRDLVYDLTDFLREVCRLSLVLFHPH